MSAVDQSIEMVLTNREDEQTLYELIDDENDDNVDGFDAIFSSSTIGNKWDLMSGFIAYDYFRYNDTESLVEKGPLIEDGVLRRAIMEAMQEALDIIVTTLIDKGKGNIVTLTDNVETLWYTGAPSDILFKAVVGSLNEELISNLIDFLGDKGYEDFRDDAEKVSVEGLEMVDKLLG